MAEGVHCPVCSADRPVRLWEPAGAYELYRCNTCDLTFSNPMRPPGSSWYEAAYLIRHRAVDDRIREYFRWALDRLPSACRVLDVGCGEGTFVAYAQRRGFDAWGIDFSASSIEAGRRRYGLTTLRVAAIEDMRGVTAVPFQAVTSFEVLEHVESPVAFLQQLADVLPPGGYLVLSVPNRDRWPIREFSDFPPNHLTRWSDRSLQWAARRAGLTVEAIGQTSRLLSINALFGYFPRRAFYAMVGLGKYGIGSEPNSIGRLAERSRLLGSLGTIARRLRDLVMWVPTVTAAPILWHRCQGYNLMLLARKPTTP